MAMGHIARNVSFLLCVAIVGIACASDEQPPASSSGTAASPGETPAEPVKRTAQGGNDESLPRGVSERPPWLGQRVLPEGPDGYGIAQSTPKILRNRRLVTEDHLPPPERDRFQFSIGRIPGDVLKRSTWRRACPVSKGDLGYVTVTFWGFDRKAHTGELIVHRSVARDVVSVFRSLYRDRWPLEEMRVTRRSELDAAPTGDGNNTGAFVCRPARLSQEWSEHAFGLAIDVNPFHNPYVRGGLVLPERALVYRNRGWRRPGMIRDGDVVTRAFARIGWGWGGHWSSAKDWMHFSKSGT